MSYDLGHAMHESAPFFGAPGSAPGKRALTDRMPAGPRGERAGETELAVAPDATSPWTEPPISSEVSFVDSLLTGPMPAGKKIPLYTHARPHKLDGGVAAAVLLRRIYEKSRVDPKAEGDVRTMKLIFAADDVTELTRELLQIVKLEPPTWSELGLELSHAVRGMGRLHAEARGPEKERLTGALADLERAVDPKVFATVKKQLPGADVLPAMNDQERLELAAQAVIAACRQAALFKQMKPGDDLAQARVLMQQMRLHYDAAADAVHGISDRRLLMRLNSDVELATRGMDTAQQFIRSTSTPLPWDRTFAEGFDAEQRFLALVGRHELQQARVFSGTVDPTQAGEQLVRIADGSATARAWSQERFKSPQQAVVGIGVILDEIYARQGSALKDAASALIQPRPPHEPSLLEIIFDILLKSTLAGAAAAIGVKIAAAVKLKLEKALVARAPSSHMFTPHSSSNGDYFAARQAAMADALTLGAGSTTMKAEIAKDAFKEFFKTSGYKAITSVIDGGGARGSINPNVLLAFSERGTAVLDRARLEGRIAYVHLAPALGQAEPDALWEVYETLRDHLDGAYQIQLNTAVEEWQNFKASAFNGMSAEEAKTKGHGAKAGDVKFGGPSSNEKGVLMVDANVDASEDRGLHPSSKLTSLRLPDAEEATLTHLRRQRDRTLADVHMNQHYRLKFVNASYERTMNVAMGPDGVVQSSMLNPGDLAALRVMRQGDRFNSVHWMQAMKGDEPRFARFSESELLKYFEREFVKKIRSTANVSQVMP